LSLRRSPSHRSTTPERRWPSAGTLLVAATKAGLPQAGLHRLRHSAAGVMPTGGVPLKAVSDILGHSTIATTGDIYGHVSPDVARQAMDLPGEALDR
jgi:integrase